MGQMEKAKKILAEVQTAPKQETDDSMTDLHPGGLPRALSGADLRILARLTDAAEDMDGFDTGMCIVYMLHQADIHALWKLARKPAELTDRAFDWSATIGASEFTEAMAAAMDAVNEFQTLTGGDETDDDADPTAVE